ncbi:hypothetical protein PCE1_004305 [Barthelona sp. PCE]
MKNVERNSIEARLFGKKKQRKKLKNAPARMDGLEMTRVRLTAQNRILMTQLQEERSQDVKPLQNISNEINLRNDLEQEIVELRLKYESILEENKLLGNIKQNLQRHERELHKSIMSGDTVMDHEHSLKVNINHLENRLETVNQAINVNEKLHRNLEHEIGININESKESNERLHDLEVEIQDINMKIQKLNTYIQEKSLSIQNSQMELASLSSQFAREKKNFLNEINELKRLINSDIKWQEVRVKSFGNIKTDKSVFKDLKFILECLQSKNDGTVSSGQLNTNQSKEMNNELEDFVVKVLSSADISTTTLESMIELIKNLIDHKINYTQLKNELSQYKKAATTADSITGVKLAHVVETKLNYAKDNLERIQFNILKGRNLTKILYKNLHNLTTLLNLKNIEFLDFNYFDQNQELEDEMDSVSRNSMLSMHKFSKERYKTEFFLRKRYDSVKKLLVGIENNVTKLCNASSTEEDILLQGGKEKRKFSIEITDKTKKGKLILAEKYLDDYKLRKLNTNYNQSNIDGSIIPVPRKQIINSTINKLKKKERDLIKKKKGL